VLRRIFGLKRDEETGGWRKLHNEDHHNLHSSPSISQVKEDETGRACSTNEGRRGMHIRFQWEGHEQRNH
jgi:hypothetical protein